MAKHHDKAERSAIVGAWRTNGLTAGKFALKRTFDVDVLHGPKCHGRRKLVAMVTNPVSIARYLAELGEQADVPPRAPSRGASVVEKHRPAPKGARRRRVASSEAHAGSRPQTANVCSRFRKPRSTRR